MQRVHVTQNFPQPVEEVFEHFSRHENAGPLFGARCRLLREGTDGRTYGVGSEREVHVRGIPRFVETYTAVILNELIRYKITRGGLLKDHEGIMRFSRQGSGSRLEYTIEFDGKLPLVATIVRSTLQRTIAAGLRKYAAGRP